MEGMNIVARVVSKSKVVELRGKKHATAIIEDATGQIKLNLWRGQVDQVDEWDLILVSDAFVHVRLGEKQMSTWSELKKASINEFV
jgi:hypothetical protein